MFEEIKNIKSEKNDLRSFGFIFGTIFLIISGFLLWKEKESFYYKFIFFGLLLTALFSLGLWKLRDELKINMSVLFITAGISVYGFEIFLEFYYAGTQSTSELLKTKAEQIRAPFDKRSKLEVLENLIDSGIKAYPNIIPKKFVGSNGLKTVSGRIYPLGGISNITTILSNESGYYPIIQTDEHGFNNSKGLYEVNNVDIVLTGDSYTEGYSVQSDENIAAVLRESGWYAISIGQGSNGPLIELAAVKEYAEPLKPKIVLWLYFVNDMGTIKEEIKSSLLQNYLNVDDFTQNLISRQEEIDSLLVGYIEDERERERERERVKVSKKIIRIMLIRNFRENFLYPTPKPSPIFKDILQKSKQMVQGWGGKMYFVYLPRI